eukprot:12880176-Prorocentrum_lima.AAC.1
MKGNFSKLARAGIAQSAANRSHNPKVVSSILTSCRLGAQWAEGQTRMSWQHWRGGTWSQRF